MFTPCPLNSLNPNRKNLNPQTLILKPSTLEDLFLVFVFFTYLDMRLD